MKRNNVRGINPKTTHYLLSFFASQQIACRKNTNKVLLSKNESLTEFCINKSVFRRTLMVKLLS